MISRKALRKLVNKFDLTGSAVTIKKLKKKYVHQIGCRYTFGIRFGDRNTKVIFTETVTESEY